MIVAWPPFTRLRLDAEGFQLRKLAALLPLAAAAGYCFGAEYLVKLAVMLAAAAVMATAAVRLGGARIGWARAAYEAALLSLMALRTLPWQLAWICPALSLGLRSLLGGKDGPAPVNAPAAALAAIMVMSGGAPAHVSPWPAPAWFGPAADQYFLSGILPVGLSALALFMLLARLHKFRLAAGFGLPVLFLSGLEVYNSGGSWSAVSGQLLALNGMLAAAAFLASDESSTPRAGWAQAVHGLAAAAVFMLFAARGQIYQAVVWSAFIPSLAAPWLDAAAAYRKPMPMFPPGPGSQG